MVLQPGLQAALTHVVTAADTAAALGSGDVPVLGTPRLLALAEAATVAALAGRLEPGQTSVGTEVALEHLRPSGIGAEITVRAELVARDGRLVRFDVTAADGTGALVGRGRVTRAVLDRARFLAAAVTAT